jgi:hypothetical protein
MRAGTALLVAGAVAHTAASRGASACEFPPPDPARARAAGVHIEPRAAEAGPRSTDPAEVGEWRLLEDDSEVLAVHAALLPTGKVLIVAGSGNDHNYRSGINEARLFDPATESLLGFPEFAGAHVPPNDPPTLNDNDPFCAGHSFLPDGRLLFVGGQLEYPTGWVHRVPGVTADLDHQPGTYDHPLPYDNPEIIRPDCHGMLGLREAFIFDAATGAWSRGEKMDRGRWYPSTLLLGDGSILAMHGYDDVGLAGCLAAVNKTAERYDPASDAWSDPVPYPAGLPSDLYPYLHLLPSGDVFYAGPSPQTRVIDPLTLATVGGVLTTTRGYREGQVSVLLPLLPEDNYRPRVLNAAGITFFTTQGTAQAEIVDLSSATPSWQQVAPMGLGRVHAPSVVLPDGHVLVVGGSAVNEVAGQGVLDAEIFDPAAGIWRDAGTAAVERHYHSVALLLPDGRVWVGGGNPNRPPAGDPDPYNPDPCAPGQPCHQNPHDSHGFNELRMEIYSPAYLFRGSRPTVVEAPATVRQGEAFAVRLADAAEAARIARVALIRLGSTTHTRNFDQRYLALERVAAPGAGTDTVTVAIAPNASLAPPGYYMLFAIDDDGVPSVARFVRVDTAGPACDGAPDLDDDGITNPCDGQDATLTISRVRLRASKRPDKPNGRVKVTGEALVAAGAPALDTGGGIAVRVTDGEALDLRGLLAAGECESSREGRRVRCSDEEGTLKLTLRQSKTSPSMRFALKIGGLAVASPFAPPLTVTLTIAPALQVAGLDWAGTIATCGTGTGTMNCH